MRRASDHCREGAAGGSPWPENEASLSEAGRYRGGAGVAGGAGLPAGAEPEEATGARNRSSERKRWRRRRWRDGVQPGEVHLRGHVFADSCFNDIY